MHVLIHNVQDALGGLIHVEAEFFPNPLNGSGGGFRIQRHFAAQQIGREMAQDNVGVCHRRLRPALAVAGRTGNGAGTLRTDPERAGNFGHMGNGAAAGPDTADIDRRNLNREIAQGGFTRNSLVAILTQGHVGGRAAHIEGQQMREACLFGNIQRPRDATGRT